MARNSARSRSQISAAVKNASTRCSAACTGLRHVTVRIPAYSRIAAEM